jgi:hypothetical protein
MELDTCPGLYIPCENLQVLKELLHLLYDDLGILTDEAIVLKNVTDKELEEINEEFELK